MIMNKTNITMEVDGVEHRLVRDDDKDFDCLNNCSLATKCFKLADDEVICCDAIEDGLVPPGLYHYEREEVNNG